MTKPRFVHAKRRELTGLDRSMSLSQNQTQELWQKFMPEWKSLGIPRTELYSVEVYPEGYFTSFDPNKAFIKWAAMQLTSEINVPATWERLEVPEGLYAVFPYKGRSSEVQRFFQYIYGAWVPNSEYTLDHRPHFAIMGEKYRNDDPESEEEFWIPVKPK